MGDRLEMEAANVTDSQSFRPRTSMSRDRPVSEYDIVHNLELTISRAISTDIKTIPFADSSDVAYVIYDFRGRNEHELSVTRGSKLRIVERRGNVWHLAEDQAGQIGLVPQDYLADEADILECPALFKYETKSKNQLSFQAGDTLLIINRINDHW